MFLLDWYKQWLDIRTEFRARQAEVVVEETVCKSCETLKQQLEVANYEKEKLLNKLLTTPDKEPERTTAPEPQAVRPKTVPWHVRRQMLEREDREKAKLLRNAPKTDTEQKADVAELERELDVAEATREAQTVTAGKEQTAG